MESKLWIKLCALLLLFLSALASHENDALPADSEVSLEEIGLLNVSSNNTDSGHGSSTVGTAENDTIPLIPLSKSNGTVTNSTELPEINGTFTEDSTQTTSLPVSPPTEKSPPTSTALSSTNTNDTSTVATPTTASHVAITNTSHHIVPVHTSTTSNPTHSTTATSQVPQATATTTKPTTSSTTAQASTPASKPKMTTSGTHSDAPSEFPSAKAHADTPSQLNVGEDTTVVHDAPTLDPLLAGLVSAFIISAVIITLLLFLKLRRRDTRPEFRRLQDLPMDDMEDTPLSMYSY